MSEQERESDQSGRSSGALSGAWNRFSEVWDSGSVGDKIRSAPELLREAGRAVAEDDSDLGERAEKWVDERTGDGVLGEVAEAGGAVVGEVVEGVSDITAEVTGVFGKMAAAQYGTNLEAAAHLADAFDHARDGDVGKAVLKGAEAVDTILMGEIAVVREGYEGVGRVAYEFAEAGFEVGAEIREGAGEVWDAARGEEIDTGLVGQWVRDGAGRSSPEPAGVSGPAGQDSQTSDSSEAPGASGGPAADDDGDPFSFPVVDPAAGAIIDMGDVLSGVAEGAAQATPPEPVSEPSGGYGFDDVATAPVLNTFENDDPVDGPLAEG